MRELTVEVEGGSLWSEARGSGPPVVLLHAGIGDSGMYDDQVDVFARDHLVVRYDARGFGRSPVQPGELSVRRDLLAVLDAYGLERAALVGTSLGANTALQVAVTAPERVSALVLAGAGLPGHEWSAEIDAYNEAEDRAAAAGDVEAAVEANLEMWLSARAPAAVRERLAEMLRRSFALQFPVWDDVTSEQLDPPVTALLGEIGVPTLVLVGRADVADMHELAARIHAGVPGAEHAVLDGAAHIPSMERPEAFSRLVLGFLARAVGTGAARVRSGAH
ncbi:MAG TPA: alpha/beta fold hydrolase [Gaiellaceae bacterium]|nr:alpha/beta fold hydrolase [Gaiellaceae bacterium]